MRNLVLLTTAVLLLSAFPVSVLSICDDGSEYLEEHPFKGTCECDRQLWVSEGCKEGFWCSGTTGAGCYKACAEGEFLITHIDYNYWECVEEGVGSTNETQIRIGSEAYYDLPARSGLDFAQDGRQITTCPVDGGYHICPSDSAPAPPVETPTENPLGNCRCNGEIWVSEGCKYAWRCEAGGGDYFSCPIEGEFIHFNTDTNEVYCSGDIGNCYGGSIDGIGCSTPACSFYNNPYGECGCEGQFFINDDCTNGFLCTDKIPDPFQYEGCFKECLNNQVLIPDWGSSTWRCIDHDSTTFKCPGKFNLFCPSEDIGNEFDGSMCECDGQLIVSSDCKSSFYCLDRLPGGGAPLTCEEPDEIVDVNFETFDYTCSKDVENCPSNMGGFKFGCEGSNIPIAPPTCNFTTVNTIGECRCQGQIMVSEDCKKSFYCTTYSSNPDDVGCELNCPDGYRVQVDLKTKQWECIPEEDNFICPGKLELDCPNDPKEVSCGCKNEVWVNDDCSSAFICARAEDEAGTSVGSTLNCGDLVMHFLFNYPLRYTCEGPDSGYECPGSYHFGCEGGDIGELTTSPITTTPGTTTQGGDGQTTTTTTTQGGGGDTTTTATQGGTTTDTMPGSTQPSGSGLLMASTLLSVLALLPLIIS